MSLPGLHKQIGMGHVLTGFEFHPKNFFLIIQRYYFQIKKSKKGKHAGAIALQPHTFIPIRVQRNFRMEAYMMSTNKL